MLCVSGQAVTIYFCDDIEIKMRPRRGKITVGRGGGELPMNQYNCLLSVYYTLNLPTVSQKSRNCDLAVHTSFSVMFTYELTKRDLVVKYELRNFVVNPTVNLI